MNMSVCESPSDLMPSQDDTPQEGVQTQVWELLAKLYPNSHPPERRREQRHPFPYLVHVTPVADDGMTPTGRSLVVVGKHLSERGLGFYHPQPISHRRVIVSLETDNGRCVSFLVDLSWCRFTKQGWYESGGRFLQPISSPIEPSK